MANLNLICGSHSIVREMGLEAGDGQDILEWITNVLGSAEVMAGRLGSCAPYMVLDSRTPTRRSSDTPWPHLLQHHTKAGRISKVVLQRTTGERCRNPSLFTTLGEVRFHAPVLGELCVSFGTLENSMSCHFF